jgi:GT2 family glycosyltransferase
VSRVRSPRYVKLYSRIVAGVGRRLPQPVKNLIKKIWSPWPLQVEIPAIAPRVDAAESTTVDVLCFGIDAAQELADACHRVFVLETVPTPRMLDDLRRERGIIAAVSIVQSPAWMPAAEEARARFGWRIVRNGTRDAIRDAHVKVSIIVVTYFNRELTRLCLDAVLRTALHPHFEIIVVDNASTDGTPEMLEEYARRHGNFRVILNRTNRGFAAANNQGLRAATGDVLVLLNNDTVPARGWLPRMLRHLDDPRIGLVVAVTNFSGNESRIAVPYTTLDGMPAFAEDYARANEGKAFDIGVAAMYCVGLRRDTYEKIGPLDEEFTVGMFEDDDYSHRARLAGLRVVCAEDVFVHHFGQASFGKLPRAEYDAIWRHNQAHYERKWGIAWTPHTGR